MSLADRLHAIRDSDESLGLAELLGVDASTIQFDWRGVTVDGETISYEDARRAIARDDGEAPRTVNIEDL